MTTRLLCTIASLVCALALAACVTEPPADRGEPSPAVATATSAILAVTGCTASSTCAFPFNGVAVSCTAGATASCAGFSDRVTCGGVTTNCAMPTNCNTCNPDLECCTIRIIGGQRCIVPSPGGCI